MINYRFFLFNEFKIYFIKFFFQSVMKGFSDKTQAAQIITPPTK